MLVGVLRFKLDLDLQRRSAEAPVMAYVAGHLAAGQTYLTPVKLQEFRLETGAPVYVDFKSIPYQDEDVLEWYRREEKARRFYKEGDCTQLQQFAEQEGVQRFLLPADHPARACPGLKTLYADSSYLLLAFNP